MPVSDLDAVLGARNLSCVKMKIAIAVLAVLVLGVVAVFGNATNGTITVTFGEPSNKYQQCCQHQLDQCKFSCLNKTNPGIVECSNSNLLSCLNTTLYCQRQRGDIIRCDCLPLYSESSAELCHKHKINGIKFQDTAANEVAFSEDKCLNADFPKALVRCEFDRTCGSGRYRFAPNSLQTFDCGDIITSLLEHVLTNGTAGFNMSYIGASLSNFTKSVQQLSQNQTSYLVAFVAFVKIKAQTENYQVGSKLFSEIVAIADKLVESWSNSTRERHPSLTALEKTEQQELAYSLSALAQRFNLDNATYRFTSNFLDMEVSDNIDLGTAVTFQSNRELANGKQPLRVIVPSSALTKAASQSRMMKKRRRRSWQSVRSSFIYYQNDVLFYSDQEEVKAVVSVDLGVDVEITNLTEPVRIQNLDELAAYNKTPVAENTLKSLRTRSQCVYWDRNFGRWSSDGCCLYVTDLSSPECRCFHLTNFAVIVKSDVVTSDVALSLVSDIGCILSMVGLFLTVVVHLIDREIRQRRPVKIVIHICCNLFLSYLIFVVAIGRNDNYYGCLVATALLHYFFLTAWCWMTVYSFDMYKSLVKVFDERPRHFLQLCLTYAYGVPLFIVVATAGVAIGYFDQKRSSDLCNPAMDRLLESHYHAPNMCWLHNYSLYLGFLAPVGAMLLYNLTVFGRVTYELSCNTSQARSRELQRTVKQNLIIAVTMTSMLGLTWASGYLVLISDDPIFETITSWVFAVLCTLQGFAIFILTSVRRSDMRKVWLSPLRNMARRTSVITASGIFRSAPRKQSTSSAMISANGTAGDSALVYHPPNGKHR